MGSLVCCHSLSLFSSVCEPHQGGVFFLPLLCSVTFMFLNLNYCLTCLVLFQNGMLLLFEMVVDSFVFSWPEVGNFLKSVYFSLVYNQFPE